MRFTLKSLVSSYHFLCLFLSFVFVNKGRLNLFYIFFQGTLTKDEWEAAGKDNLFVSLIFVSSKN